MTQWADQSVILPLCLTNIESILKKIPWIVALELNVENSEAGALNNLDLWLLPPPRRLAFRFRFDSGLAGVQVIIVSSQWTNPALVQLAAAR